MQIVLNHVTRMRSPRICIAGIDPKRGRPERHWLQVNGVCLEDRPLGERP